MSRPQGLSLLMLLVLIAVGVIVLRGIAQPPAPAAVASAAAPAAATPDTVWVVAPPAAPVEAAPAAATIARVPLDGQDIADAMDLRMWKFHFTLPRGEYTSHVWIERWTRGSDKPEVALLSQMSDTWDKNDLVIELPTETRAQPFIRVAASTARATGVEPILRPTGTAVLDDEPLPVGGDIYLVTMTYDTEGKPPGGRRDIHKIHDQTIYVKTRFVPGFLVPFSPDKLAAPAAPTPTPSGSPAPPP